MTGFYQEAEEEVDHVYLLAKTWLQKHERLIVAALLFILVLWFGNRWFDRAATQDKQAATIAAQQLAQQKTANAQLADQIKQNTAQYQQTVAAVTQQNAQLSAEIKSRQTSLAAQQASDSSMSTAELAQRWEELAGVNTADVTASSTGVTTDTAASKTTVEDLEQVPVLEKNLQDTQGIVANDQKEISACTQLNTQLNQQVSGLDTQIADGQKACQTQTASVKAQANKSKRNWFLIGLGVGAFLITHL